MRFYFDVRDRLAIRDGVGRELRSISQAMLHAKYLAADLLCLEPNVWPRLSIQVIGEDSRQIREEAVFT